MLKLFVPSLGLLIAFGLSLVLPTSDLHGAVVFQFQEGLEGYEGTADTRLRGRSSSGWEDLQNYGGAPSLVVQQAAYNSTGSFTAGNQNNSTSLIRFDDLFGTGPGQVDPNVEILSATLKLTATTRTANNATRNFRVGALLTPFTEGSSNGSFEAGATTMFWQTSPSVNQNPVETLEDGTPWAFYELAGPESPNQRQYGGPESDVDFHFSGEYHTTVPIFEDGEYTSGTVTITEPYLFEIDITPIVLAWQQGTLANHGLHLFHTQSGATNLVFRSSESAFEDQRPMLEIVAVPEPAAFGAATGLGLITLCMIRRAWTR